MNDIIFVKFITVASVHTVIKVLTTKDKNRGGILANDQTEP